MTPDDSTRSRDEPTVQMIGTLPPWKGIPAYCESLYRGISDRWEQFTFTGWTNLYPERLYPGGEPRTGEEPVEGDDVERRLSWRDPWSWISVGLDPEVDLIHAQWWSYPLAIPYVVVFLVGKARGKTVLLTIHNVAPHEQNVLTTFLNDVVYRFADEYVVHSDRNRTQLGERTSVNPDEVHVIPHPVIGPEKRHVPAAEAREQLGLEPDSKTILFFGNIREYKGLGSLLEMVARMTDRHDVDLLVAGKSWVDWDAYERQIERLGLAEHVHRYPGYIPDDQLELFFSAADVVALPYEHFDAQSGVARLADHFGTVTVGYDVGGLGEQVDVVASDEADFEESLATVLYSDVEKGPVTDDAAERHVDLYAELLDARVGGTDD